MERVTKGDLTIIFKPHAHPHTMKKSQAKFQNNRNKTVRGVALRARKFCFPPETTICSPLHVIPGLFSNKQVTRKCFALDPSSC